MARLLKVGNNKIQKREQQWGFFENDDIRAQIEKLLVIYVDDIVTKQKLTSLQVQINLK